MSDVIYAARPARCPRSIYQVHYGLPKQPAEETRPWPPADDDMQVFRYRAQVAGHGGEEDKDYLGLLQSNNGTILKPILKESQKREIDFYARISTAEERDLVELRKLIPAFHGCRHYTYRGREREYIVLDDLAQGMLEPCIMDVKIGKRTWDPLATEEKIMNEQTKYAACKHEFGFCIPGFQVHKLASGKLYKYGKEHGKKLHGHMVKAAIRNFLNGMGSSLCRALILQFLTELWKIQKWSAHQSSLRLYSASLLLVYDARRLRDCCGENDVLIATPKCRPAPANRRRKSIHSMHSPETDGPSFSGQLTAAGPVYRKLNSVPITSIALAQSSFAPHSPTSSPWSEALEKMNASHSFDHNYEDKLCKIRMNYRAILNQLSNDAPTNNPWGTVKIIDFAHAFFNEEDEMGVDENFKQGIDSFVEIFEALLKETDDQVF